MRRVSSILAAGLLLLALPGTAAAATVNADAAGQVTVVSAPGEVSLVGMSYRPANDADHQWSVFAGNGLPTAGTNCTGTSFPIYCKGTGAPVGVARVDLGDADDQFCQDPICGNPTDGTRAPINAIVQGGSGADRINFVADGAPKLGEGGDGDDNLEFVSTNTSGGSTEILPGDYRLVGGEGSDFISGAHPIGPGSDSGAAEILDGGPGVDHVVGYGGNDLISGGEGDEYPSGPGTPSTPDAPASGGSVVGGSGDDVVDGGSGHDFVDGGSGNDQLFGGAGDDVVYSEEAAGGSGSDTVSCGDGNDSALPDPTDLVQLDCELVGALQTCQGDAQSCSGTVALDPASAAARLERSTGTTTRKPKGSLGKGKFKLAGGTSGDATARISGKGRSYVTRHKKVRGVVTIVKRIKLKSGKVKTETTRRKVTLATTG